METKSIGKLKLVFACIGAGFCVLGAVIALMAFSAGPANSGPSELTLHPENQEQIVARRRAEELQQTLSLSEEQTSQLAAMFVTFRREAKELRRQNTGGGGALFMAGRAKMQEFEQAVRGILTPEQAVKFDEMKTGRMERFSALRQLMQPSN